MTEQIQLMNSLGWFSTQTTIIVMVWTKTIHCCLFHHVSQTSNPVYMRSSEIPLHRNSTLFKLNSLKTKCHTDKEWLNLSINVLLILRITAQNHKANILSITSNYYRNRKFWPPQSKGLSNCPPDSYWHPSQGERERERKKPNKTKSANEAACSNYGLKHRTGMFNGRKSCCWK